MKAPPVLVADGGAGFGRPAVGAVRALAAAGYRPVVARSDALSLAAASRSVTRVVDVPPVASDAYAAAIRDELARDDYVDVFLDHDAGLLAMGLPVEHLLDKEELVRGARSVGLPVPEGESFEDGADLAAAAGRLPYPVVVKPRVRSTGGNRPAYRADGPADLNLVTGGSMIVQPFVEGTMTAVAGVVEEGRLIAAVHQRYLRTWPVACGTASAAVTVEANLDLEQRIVALLPPYDGVFQAQFRGGRLLDLNPRIYGSLPLAVRAGANLPAIRCRVRLGPCPKRVIRGAPGLRFRWVEGDLRHVAHEVRAGRLTLPGALGALRPRSGTAHSTESLADPRPALMRILALARRR